MSRIHIPLIDIMVSVPGKMSMLDILLSSKEDARHKEVPFLDSTLSILGTPLSNVFWSLNTSVLSKSAWIKIYLLDFI